MSTVTPWSVDVSPVPDSHCSRPPWSLSLAGTPAIVVSSKQHPWEHLGPSLRRLQGDLVRPLHSLGPFFPCGGFLSLEAISCTLGYSLGCCDLTVTWTNVHVVTILYQPLV